MEVRPDTSSGRSNDVWSFLNQGTAGLHDAQQPPSSYLRSEEDSISPLPNGQNVYTGSRTTLSRDLPSASTGARSTTTSPPQTVLLRINSETAYDHNNRPPRRQIKKEKMTGLPALEEFTIQGMLSAVSPDIEADLNTIAEILGRSKFTLADQYEAQLPPQGEITMYSPDQEITEDPTHSDHVVGDHVGIVAEGASLQEGSTSGSAYYRAVENHQIVGRPARVNSDAPILDRSTGPVPPIRTLSSPGAIQPEPELSPIPVTVHTVQRETSSRPSDRGPARPVVSGTYVSAGADGPFSVTATTNSEATRHDPLTIHVSPGVLESNSGAGRQSIQPRRLQGWFVPNLPSLNSWFVRRNTNTEAKAEESLRILLNR